MDPEEASAEGQMGADLKGAVDRLHSAMQKRWETEEWEASLAYEISIPAQTLTIYGKEHAEYVLRSLKGLRVSGTYSITRK